MEQQTATERQNSELLKMVQAKRKSQQNFLRIAGWQMALLGVFQKITELAASEGVDPGILRSEAKQALEFAKWVNDQDTAGTLPACPEKVWLEKGPSRGN